MILIRSVGFWEWLKRAKSSQTPYGLCLIFSLSMLVPFGPMEAPHYSAARKGSSSISDVTLDGQPRVALERPYTEAITAGENAHRCPLPSSSKRLCVNDFHFGPCVPSSWYR